MSDPDRDLVVTKSPKRPKPLPQSSGPDDCVLTRGDDAAPMRWADARPCGHRIMARIGPAPMASMFDRDAPLPLPAHANFAAVPAMPGECPTCDGATRMPVRDADTP